jgi:hypothetical protein
MAFRRRRKRHQDPAGDTPQPPPRKKGALVRLLTADLVLRAGGYALRQAISKDVLSGRAGEKAAKAAHAQSNLSTRVVTAAATAVATRSVPGAVLVGTGMAIHALYKRGKARRAQRLLDTTDVGGTLPPT